MTSLLERLLDGEDLGADAAGAATQAIDYLRAMQAPDGSLPAWSDGRLPGRCDVTAQAVRLFVLRDADGLRSSIDAGLAFLQRHTDEHGATVYEAGSEDRNTWTTLFAAQARDWARGDAEPRVEALL